MHSNKTLLTFDESVEETVLYSSIVFDFRLDSNSTHKLVGMVTKLLEPRFPGKVTFFFSRIPYFASSYNCKRNEKFCLL